MDIKVNYLWWHNCEIELKIKLSSISEAEKLEKMLKELNHCDSAKEIRELINQQIKGVSCQKVRKSEGN